MAVRELRFSLAISPQEYQRYYQGGVRYVLVRAHDGRTVQFPADALRPFVGHQGVHGEFALRLDDDNKLLGLRRVER